MTSEITEAMVDYIGRYGGRCRDCADEDGVCPTSGLPCGADEKAIRHVLGAYAYGVKHGFIPALDAALPQGEDVGGVVELIKSRVDQEFDGEAHFSTAEALSFADLIAFLSAKVAEVEREREANRWNTQFEGEDLLICENNHEKGEPCEYERWVRVAKLTATEARAERLEEALWVIASRNKSRDQLQEMARAALQQEGESDE